MVTKNYQPLGGTTITWLCIVVSKMRSGTLAHIIPPRNGWELVIPDGDILTAVLDLNSNFNFVSLMLISIIAIHRHMILIVTSVRVADYFDKWYVAIVVRLNTKKIFLVYSCTMMYSLLMSQNHQSQPLKEGTYNMNLCMQYSSIPTQKGSGKTWLPFCMNHRQRPKLQSAK